MDYDSISAVEGIAVEVESVITSLIVSTALLASAADKAYSAGHVDAAQGLYSASVKVSNVSDSITRIPGELSAVAARLREA